MFRNNILLLLLVANIIGNVSEQVDERIGEVADKLYGIFLSPNVIGK